MELIPLFIIYIDCCVFCGYSSHIISLPLHVVHVLSTYKPWFKTNVQMQKERSSNALHYQTCRSINIALLMLPPQVGETAAYKLFRGAFTWATREQQASMHIQWKLVCDSVMRQSVICVCCRHSVCTIRHLTADPWLQHCSTMENIQDYWVFGNAHLFRLVSGLIKWQ